jgi:ribose transport system ATP-binding protein
VTAALVSLAGLSKTYTGQLVLDGVDLTIARGEVHALLGANGSGKSTLIKILTGVVPPDHGASVTIGEETEPLHRGAVGGRIMGMPIRVVHQDLGLVEALSVVDNVALSDGYHRRAVGTVDWKQEAQRARQLLQSFDLPDLDVFAPMSALSALEKVQVAIARVMGSWGDEKGLLVLDEPTAQLPESASDHLFRLVEQIRAQGNSVLFVTHRLAEVFRIADSVTILRQGRRVHRGPVSEIDHRTIVEHIVGRHYDVGTPRSGNGSAVDGKVALQVTGLTGAELDGLDLTVRAGEIVGLVGIVGAGHAAVAPSLVGVEPVTGGEVVVGGTHLDLRRVDPRTARAAGIAWVPPDRKRDGIVAGLSVRDNVTLSVLGRFRRAGALLDHRAAEREARRWQERVDLQPRDTSRMIQLLSGGNQQKAVIARNLASDPVVLMLSEPTAGVDIGARDQLYDIINAAARDGVGAVVTSTDYGDLAALCHRVLVVRDGRVAAELRAPGLTEGQITRAVLSSEHEAPSPQHPREVAS